MMFKETRTTYTKPEVPRKILSTNAPPGRIAIHSALREAGAFDHGGIDPLPSVIVVGPYHLLIARDFVSEFPSVCVAVDLAYEWEWHVMVIDLALGKQIVFSHGV